MNFSKLTWPQVALLVACAIVVLAAYKFLGDGAAMCVMAVTHLLAAVSSPKDPPAPPAVTDSPNAGPYRTPAAPAAPAAPEVKGEDKTPPTLRFLAFACFLVGFAFVMPTVAACGASPWLTDLTQIEACQMQGRAVKYSDAGADGAAWRAYDDCMRASGYRDAEVK